MDGALALEHAAICSIRKQQAGPRLPATCRRQISLNLGTLKRRKQQLHHVLQATKQSDLVLSDVESTLLENFQTQITGMWGCNQCKGGLCFRAQIYSNILVLCTGSDADAIASSHSLLLEAVAKRKVQPDKVLGAMLYLEDQSRKAPTSTGTISDLPTSRQTYECECTLTLSKIMCFSCCGADVLSELQGSWRLVFSGPSKLKFLSYIPVDEDFVVDSADSSLKLESDLGPLRAKFGGTFKWRSSSNDMDFSFTRAEVRAAFNILVLGVGDPESRFQVKELARRASP